MSTETTALTTGSLALQLPPPPEAPSPAAVAAERALCRLPAGWARDPWAAGRHGWSVSRLSRCLARALGLSERQTALLAAAAPFHDVGKLAIPSSILEKTGTLDRDEWRVIQSHPILGAGLLVGSSNPLLRTAREIALAHHERWDGSGYPYGLRGREIPLPARVVALADHYDALRSARPYKSAMSHGEACRILLEGSSARTRPRHFDPAVLEAFDRVEPRFELLYDELPVPA